MIVTGMRKLGDNIASLPSNSNTMDFPGPTVRSDGVLLVVTTTIYAGGASPTATLVQEKNIDPLPVGAIAGGAAGGVVLAVLAVIFWKLWGRSIKRDEERKRNEAVSVSTRILACLQIVFMSFGRRMCGLTRHCISSQHAALAVRANTRRNASAAFSTPSTQYQPAFAFNAAGRKIKFAASDKSRRGARGAADPRPRTSQPYVTEKAPYTSFRLSSTPFILPEDDSPTNESPMIDEASLSNAPTSPAEGSSGRRFLQVPPLSRGAGNNKGYSALRSDIPVLSHKASTGSSESWYSTHSGDSEEWAPSSPGPARRFLQGLQKLDPTNRLSTLTRSSGSMYSANDG
ncbi:hypothetical protein EW146_g493 [Bondarzewia mesenterica]|uniref:Uncharacterized protein n=1 Tax=Bondarzewia mesenterica TaxID=1095465 RepID=A0A4S4M6P1_9AGAM|nr:hypothetical protein EW146_g493 [Bondarzewia mesenterica]